MFRGANAINLDAKGRLAMPARYRDRLLASCDGQLVVTIALEDRCLWIYPLHEWEAVEAKLRPGAQHESCGQASATTADR